MSDQAGIYHRDQAQETLNSLSGETGTREPSVRDEREFGDAVPCPYCGQEIGAEEGEAVHDMCEHLGCIYLTECENDHGSDVSRRPAFLDWWRNQGFPSLHREHDIDPETVSVFGYDDRLPQLVRVICAYETAPHTARLVAQEGQGFGPCYGSIGPVLFDFSKTEASQEGALK